MTINNIDVSAAVKRINRLLASDKSLSEEARAMFELILVVVSLLINKLGLNSTNSSKPPSSDPNRPKKPRAKTGKKPGGQVGHKGSNLKPTDTPDVVEVIEVDRRTIPAGKYKDSGFEARQVFDIKISSFVTEYRAQILEDSKGNRYVADFPDGVSRPAQYGGRVKAQAVYMSQYQMLPFDRLREYFTDQCGIPISTGSLSNFNDAAYELLENFELIAKRNLIAADLLNVDETGINVNGKRLWLHSASNSKWSLFYPHTKRGHDAMEEMGVLKDFKGTLVHDHWKPYFVYKCLHALCNAHHIRELERAWEQDGQRWAKSMKELLLKIKKATESSDGILSATRQKRFLTKYRQILEEGKVQCPSGIKKVGQRGRVKNSTSRNLLDRLETFEAETLRFMTDKNVPFTNNAGENDIRMTKVQQKISGCFRAMDGAHRFCRIRSYVLTCQKNGVEPSLALDLLFQGKYPEFLTDSR